MDFDLLQEFKEEDIVKMANFLSDSQAHAEYNAHLLRNLQKISKQRLDLNIVIPQNGQPHTKGYFAKIVSSLAHFQYPSQVVDDTFEHISLFNDYMTTDALDYAVTSVPIEMQFIQGQGQCNEEESLARKILLSMNEVNQGMDLLGSTLEQKYDLLQELETKIALQNRALASQNYSDDDENIFFV